MQKNLKETKKKKNRDTQKSKIKPKYRINRKKIKKRKISVLHHHRATRYQRRNRALRRRGERTRNLRTISPPILTTADIDNRTTKPIYFEQFPTRRNWNLCETFEIFERRKGGAKVSRSLRDESKRRNFPPRSSFRRRRRRENVVRWWWQRGEGEREEREDERRRERERQREREALERWKEWGVRWEERERGWEKEGERRLRDERSERWKKP